MGSTFDRRTLLAGGAAAAAASPAASALGTGLGRLGGAGDERPGPQRHLHGHAQGGGSLVFGVDAEESGFDPTRPASTRSASCTPAPSSTP